MSKSKSKIKTVIPPTSYRKEISRDVNYFALKQKLKSLGLDFFNYVKPPKKEAAKNELISIGRFRFTFFLLPHLKKFYYGYYQEMNLYILSLWFRYKNWFNKVVNHGNK